MIIRAVSESESETDDDRLSADNTALSHRRSVFDSSGSAKRVSSDRDSGAARCLWFAVCGVLVLLVLVDLAAVFDPSPDTFALLPLLIRTLRLGEAIIVPLTASMLNQFAGTALVSVWMYTRELSFGASNSTWLRSARYGLWIVGALLFLGHVVSCLYILFALVESNGNRTKFWLGRKHFKLSTGSYGQA